jgi:hypothetical protein
MNIFADLKCNMTLTREYPTGAHAYVCVLCGRLVVVQWEPLYQVVLNPGDPHSVLHEENPIPLADWIENLELNL